MERTKMEGIEKIVLPYPNVFCLLYTNVGHFSSFECVDSALVSCEIAYDYFVQITYTILFMMYVFGFFKDARLQK